MKLSEQVCSLELAIKMKGLGFKQDSLFYHSIQMNEIIIKDWFLNQDPYNQEKLQDDSFRQAVDETYSAFTVAELGEILPYIIEMKHRGGDAYLKIGKYKNDWSVCYRVGCSKGDFKQESNTEVNARAKMLIYLIENNLINLWEN